MLFKTNKLNEFTVRQANINDSKNIMEILKAAANWIQAKGINQWGYLLEGGENKVIEADILAGNTYVIENENKEVVATFNYSNEQNEWDIEMWGMRNDNAYYIHRLAVSGKHHHKKIGKQLLLWIDENHRIENGYIRLDCVGNNVVLNNFYQDAGFGFVGHVGENDDRFSLYEKHVK